MDVSEGSHRNQQQEWHLHSIKGASVQRSSRVLFLHWFRRISQENQDCSLSLHGNVAPKLCGPKGRSCGYTWRLFPLCLCSRSLRSSLSMGEGCQPSFLLPQSLCSGSKGNFQFTNTHSPPDGPRNGAHSLFSTRGRPEECRRNPSVDPGW